MIAARSSPLVARVHTRPDGRAYDGAPELTAGPRSGFDGQGSGFRVRGAGFGVCLRPAARCLLRAFCLLLAACCLLVATACRQDMHNQPKYRTLRPSGFFADGSSARPLVEGTVARGTLQDDEAFFTGKRGNEVVSELPFPLTQDVLDRGQERFNIFCTPCHDRAGTGHGMVVQRGYSQPPSYHIDRLREAPLGHFVDVMTNGIKTMPDYKAQIPPRDRWAIAAYIRALQLSQHAAASDVPGGDPAKLAPPAQAGGERHQ